MTAIRSTFLRQVIAADAAVCGLSGVLFAFDTAAVADLTALSPALLQPVGLFLLGYAALLAWLALRPALPRVVVWTLVGFNVLWAIESVMLVTLGWAQPNGLGLTVALAQAAGALLVADLQFIALRRARAAA